MNATSQTKRFETELVNPWGDRSDQVEPLSPPIVRSTTFRSSSSQALGERFEKREPNVYSRFGSPTADLVANHLARIDGAEKALVFSSGMAAITTSLLTVLQSGDHVVAQAAIFAQTHTFLEKLAPGLGIEVDFVEARNPDAVVAAIRPKTRIVYIETPSNPLLRVVDIARIAEIATRADVLLYVDSTFGPPYLQRPLELGADLCLQSGTKFLGGHTDVLCGVASGGAELIDRIRETQMLLGGILDPQGAWLLSRGLKTLAIRVQRQSDNALEIGRFLERQPGVLAVNYPWLESHPDYSVARRQMKGGSGVLSFVVKGGLAGARAVVDALQLIPIATSLGGVETLAEIPVELDFSRNEMGDSPTEVGISPALIRLSVGIEHVEDLKADLGQALGALRGNMTTK